MDPFAHLSYHELKNRKNFLKQEYHRICTELDKREKNNKIDGDLWEPIENLKKKVAREFVLPN